MKKKYLVHLTPEEREQLTELVSKGKAAAYKIKHANVLLNVDAHQGPNWSDEQAAEAFSCAPRTIFSLRQRFVEQGLEAAVGRKKQDRPSREPILDDEKEARLIQLAGSEPPPGQARWTLRLLTSELVALGMVESISPPTVMRVLKKQAEAESVDRLGDSTRAKC